MFQLRGLLPIADPQVREREVSRGRCASDTDKQIGVCLSSDDWHGS